MAVQYGPTLQGREADLQSILEWTEDGQNTISVRLLSGAGGSGKTRLAAEAATQLRERGWSAGFVPRSAGQAQTIETNLRKFLLIFDYPEERMDVVRALVQAIQDIPDTLVDFPIRILFVSRREFADWGEVMRDLGPRAGRQELAVLDNLQVAQAQALFEETARNFSAVTGRTLPDLSKSVAWLQTDARRRVPLVVMAAAIHQVLTGQDGFGLGAAELITALARFEHDRVAKVSHDAGLGAEGLPRLLAIAAMTDDGLSDAQCEALAKQQVTEKTGQAVMDALKGTPWRRRHAELNVFRLIRPEPDRMAATFMALILLDDPSSRLPDWIAVAAEPQGSGFGDAISRIGYDLLGTPARWSDTLEQVLKEMITREPQRVALFIDIGLKEGTVFSAARKSLSVSVALPSAGGLIETLKKGCWHLVPRATASISAKAPARSSARNPRS